MTTIQELTITTEYPDPTKLKSTRISLQRDTARSNHNGPTFLLVTTTEDVVLHHTMK